MSTPAKTTLAKTSYKEPYLFFRRPEAAEGGIRGPDLEALSLLSECKGLMGPCDCEEAGLQMHMHVGLWEKVEGGTANAYAWGAV